MMPSQLENFWSMLRGRVVLLLAIVFALASTVILIHNVRVTGALVETTALQDAALYSESIAEFRTLYTSEVVAKIKDKGGTITHDYQRHPGAIPLPATLSMLLGKRIGEHRSGAETRLYSEFPFPYEGRLGLSDKFAKDAWKSLNEKPEDSFHRFEQLKGRRVLRYAIADRMRASCVDCHNTHPDTPRTGWKEGDVRGVLEVILPMDEVESATRASLRGTLLLMVVMTILGVAGLGLVIGRLEKTSTDLASRVEEVRQSEEKIKDINDELVTARDDALAASEAKSQFLANMSHELRTPLNAIIGYSEMIKEECDSTEHDWLTDLDRIRDSGVNLLAIISDILDIANIDAGITSLNPESFDGSELIAEVQATMVAAATANGNTMTVEIADDLPHLFQDRAKVRQCLRHLLSNAIKFTHDGEVHIELSKRDDQVAFAISDTGIGIAADDIQEMFKPFTQADLSSTRRFDGAGLGLSITVRFCELMGGRLDVASEVNQGSTFTLMIPREVKRDATE